MPSNIRHIVLFFFLGMSFVPFLLMTDLFPFMRFAMFAETVHSVPQRELFSVEIIDANGQLHSLSERQIGLDDSHLNYLARTYYYKDKLDFFSSELKKSGLVHTTEQLLIVQKTLEAGHWKKKILIRI